MWSILALVLIASMLLSACGATPTATPVPPTAVPPTATKAPVAPTAAPAAPTAAPAAPTAAPAAPTATKAPAAPTAVPPTATAAPRKGGTLILGSATMFQNLNPFSIPGGQWQFAFRLLTVRLINIDAKGNYLPDLAKSWDISADGKTITFNLRNDVLWSNNVKVTSMDVATTFSLHCFKDTGSNKFSILKNIEGCQDVFDGKATAVSGVKIVDSYTIQIKLATGNPGFLYTMPDVVIVPHSIFGTMAPKDIISSDYVVKGPSISSGPFTIKAFTPNEQIEYAANKLYYRGMPKLDTLIDKKIPDRNTRLLAFEKGEVDVIDDGLSTDYDRMMKLPGISYGTRPGTIEGLWINYHSDAANPKDPKYVAMQTKEFRQALAYAIDTTGLANIITGGHPENWTPQFCYWTNDIFGMGTCDPSLPKYEYNVEKAKALLKQINWDAKWVVDFRPYGLTPGPLHEALQQMWVKAGVNINLQGVDPATYIADIYGKGNFDLTWLGLGYNSNMIDFFYRFRCGNIYNAQTCPACYNMMRYCNPEFDKLVTAAMSTADPKVYEPLAKQMQTILATDLPFIPYGFGKAFRLMGPKVDGKTIPAVAYAWDDPHLWSLK
jgi:ABC-type transport system substrate-binding protein